MRYSKTIELSDYGLFAEERAFLDSVRRKLLGVPYRFEHEHRLWEYGMTLHALREVGAKRVVDVGGGGSLFAPTAVLMGMEVVQVDMGEVGGWIRLQEQALGVRLPFLQMDFFDYAPRIPFDAVTCLSVIEHVDADKKFLRGLAERVTALGLLCLTTDFHPSGQAMVTGHIRTYNRDGMQVLKDELERCDFSVLGEAPNYDFFAPYVNGCTFASLFMKKGLG